MKETAAQAHAEHLLKIYALIEELDEIIEENKRDHEDYPNRWDVVGDLGLIVQALDDLLEGFRAT